MLSIDGARELIKQEIRKIVFDNSGYKDSHFLSNGKFKKGINSPNHYCDLRILKSNLLDEFREELKKYKIELEEEIDEKVKNNNFELEELVELEKMGSIKLKRKSEELIKDVFNEVDNLKVGEIIELGIKLDSKIEDVPDNVCPKCGGTGRIEIYNHIDNGICYKCEGTGRLN